jgi:glycosyltransferase involved in cell wall biosynthesis
LSGRVPRISCIVPAYNSEATLERAVISLLETGYPSLEIVIVNDGSTDATQTVAEGLCTRFPSMIRVLTHPNRSNRGVSASRNLGIKTSSGELICFLDSDDTVFPHRFRNPVDTLNSQNEIDAVYNSATVCVNDTTQEHDWEDSSIFGLHKALNGLPLLRSLIHGIPWHTSAVVIRRSLLLRTGLFAEHLKIAEDCNLWMRMVAIGNVVAGDLDQVVSRYVRNAGSLYHAGIDRKLDYFKALAAFHHWLRRRPELHILQGFVRQEIVGWIDNSMIQFRQHGRKDLLLKLAAGIFLYSPSLMTTGRLPAHLLRGLILDKRIIKSQNDRN